MSNLSLQCTIRCVFDVLSCEMGKFRAHIAPDNAMPFPRHHSVPLTLARSDELTTIGQDTLNTRRTLDVNGTSCDYYSIPAAEKAGLGDMSKLPFSL